MRYDPINDGNTIPESGEGSLLVGRYRIVRPLGQGGMGSVWLVEDDQLDGKRFAVKMLPSILASNKKAYKQLKDEALVSMRLSHDSIVTLRAFEENGGNPFLVMDYVDGQTLDDYLAEKGSLSEEECIRVLRPIAAALDYAHTKGVIHRDVKPGNVMIDKDGAPFILDFGIAREIQETMTRVTGKLSSGTLLYMSPEQYNGDPPRKEQDIYSFAAMMYECLKGDPPFSRGNIEFQIMNKVPEPPPGGGRLVASIMAGLAKDPEARPPTCTALLDGDIPLNHPHQVPSPDSARSPWKTLILCGTVGAMLSGGIGAWWMMSDKNTPSRSDVNGDVREPVTTAPFVPAAPVVPPIATNALSASSNMMTHETIADTERQKEAAAKRAEEEAAAKRAEEERMAKETAAKKAEEERRAKEAAAKKAEEERRAKEAAAKKAEEERMAKEAAAKRAEEERMAKEAYTNCLVQIDFLRNVASNEYAKIDVIRSDPEGFENSLNDAISIYCGIMDADAPARLSDATNRLQAVSRLCEKLGMIVCGINKDRPKRDKARACSSLVSNEVVELQREFVRDDSYWRTNPVFVAVTNGLVSMQGLIAKGDFGGCADHAGAVSAELNRLRSLLEHEDSEALNAQMEVARKCAEDWRWEECSNVVRRILSVRPSHKEAKQLFDISMERLLHPCLRVLALMDGKQVKGRIRIGQQDYPTPYEWTQNLAKGIPIGPFEVTFEEGGKFYRGIFQRLTVDWQGPRVLSVALSLADVYGAGATKTITLPGGATMEMIYCPPGIFRMGSPQDEIGRYGNEEQCNVTLTKGFWLGKYPVTQQQWKSVMEYNPSDRQGDNLPVEKVSWLECKKFADRVRHPIPRFIATLPSEAQWEYACRAGTDTPYSFGNSLDGTLANCDGTHPSPDGPSGPFMDRTTEVGTYEANRWGFCDMHGNVCEWCADSYYKEHCGQEDATDPRMPPPDRSNQKAVIRGGSYRQPARQCRSASRSANLYRNKDKDVGFRLCLVPE